MTRANFQALSKGRSVTDGVILTQPRDVHPVRRGIAQQAQLERIAGTGRQVRIVRQHNGGERARHIGRVERPYVHAALGQRSGLVGRDDGHRSERLDRGESAHDGAVPGHPLDAEGQGHREHGRQPLGHRRHSQGHGKDDDLRRATDPFGDDAQQTKRRGERQHPARDLAAELIDPAFERRLRGLDVAEHGGQTTHGARGPGPRHVQVASCRGRATCR